jgi:hypothetical protein
MSYGRNTKKKCFCLGNLVLNANIVLSDLLQLLWMAALGRGRGGSVPPIVGPHLSSTGSESATIPRLLMAARTALMSGWRRKWSRATRHQLELLQ